MFWINQIRWKEFSKINFLTSWKEEIHPLGVQNVVTSNQTNVDILLMNDTPYNTETFRGMMVMGVPQARTNIILRGTKDYTEFSFVFMGVMGQLGMRKCICLTLQSKNVNKIN